MNICYGHCLNNGECVLREDKPTCKCTNDFEGERCETKKIEEIKAVPTLEQCK